MNRIPVSPRWKSALAAALCAAALAPSWALPDARFDPAFGLFNAASNGDSSAVDKAADAFDELMKAEPSNLVLMAYDGAATSMKATTTLLPWKKMGYAEDGLARLDKALALLTPAQDAVIQHGTPGSLEVKFVAANTFLAVPGFMNRAQRGAKLLDEVLASPLFASAALPFKGAVWLRAARRARAEKREPDARRWLALVIDNHAPQADKARALLQEAS
ncbi:MAG: hypothetical protein KGL43_23195 [Burkholderiales bacterium]|nr:hypothetical protein [Burkholderiales bacterium]MDE2456503.1 hypothetical protein [Burkholderiales bacterium]